MKSWLGATATLAVMLAVSACDDPAPVQPEADVVVETPVVEEAAPPPASPEVAVAPTDRPPDAGALPADKRTSEESVQPESETLFY